MRGKLVTRMLRKKTDCPRRLSPPPATVRGGRPTLIWSKWCLFGLRCQRAAEEEGARAEVPREAGSEDRFPLPEQARAEPSIAVSLTPVAAAAIRATSGVMIPTEPLAPENRNSATDRSLSPDRRPVESGSDGLQSIQDLIVGIRGPRSARASLPPASTDKCTCQSCLEGESRKIAYLVVVIRASRDVDLTETGPRPRPLWLLPQDKVGDLLEIALILSGRRESRSC